MNREKETVMITEKQYLEYLIKQYQNLIYSICLKSVGNPFDAEDLTQEVFLSAYKTPVIDTLYIMVFPIQEKERANDAYE